MKVDIDVQSRLFDSNYLSNFLSDEDKELVYNLFKDKKIRDDVKNKLKKIIFIKEPPTPEEFLNPENKWLPSSYIEGLYDYIKQDFIKAMNTDNPYSIISMYGCTRSGKSVLARLFVMYTIIYINYLRDPHSYFKINKMSRICIYLVSFKQEKTNQVYLSPILNLLDSSDMFVREHFENNVYKNNIDNEGKIHFSEAGKFGDITFPKCFIVTGKDAGSLVGADICAGAVSELTFFKQYAPGMTDEEIVQVFTKLYSRIQNTVGFGTFPCWSYIDSSANNTDSPIEKMILNDLKEKEYTYFKHYTLWKIRPHLYPKYNKTNVTFKICTGDGSTPAKIINNELDLKDIPSNLLLEVPIDLKETFERNLIDSIKDIAGIPTGSESKFIQKGSYIENIFNNPYLKNIESSIKADSTELPENLIWNQLNDKLFINSLYNKTFIYRASNEPRYIGVDLGFSLTGDASGFAVVHKEWSNELKNVMYIVDFCFAILPKEKSVNLEAIIQFIIDLQNNAQLYIKGTAIDTFQSELLKQSLERKNIEVIKQSVDRSVEPYQYFLTCLANNMIKAGKNIYLKNNLYCLQNIKTEKGSFKIDHPRGNVNHIYDGAFNTSNVGNYSKDVSDAVCQAIWLAHTTDIMPVTVYEDENKKKSIEAKDIKETIKKSYELLHKFY